MPLLTLVLGVAGCEVDLADLQNHLHADVPVFAFEVDVDPVLILPVIFEVFRVCSLLWWLEWTRFAFDEWITPEANEVDPLIDIAWRFEIDKRAVVQRNQAVNKSLDQPVERGMASWMNIIDVAVDTAQAGLMSADRRRHVYGVLILTETCLFRHPQIGRRTVAIDSGVTMPCRCDISRTLPACSLLPVAS